MYLLRGSLTVEINIVTFGSTVHRVHEKNYNIVYVAITLANNIGF